MLNLIVPSPRVSALVGCSTLPITKGHHMTANTQWKPSARNLLVSQLVSQVGSMVVQFALFWHIVLIEQTGSAVALAALATGLPLVVLSPLAGVWADRFDRRIITVLSDAITAVTTVIVMILFMMGYESAPLIYTALFLRSCSMAVQSPAVTALVPTFVPADHLVRINGMFGSVQALNSILGPAIGGAVLAIWPIAAVFLIDIVTAIIGIALFWFGVKVDGKPPMHTQPEHWLSDLGSGLHYTFNHAFLRSLLIINFIAVFLAAAPGVLSPLHVVREFGADTWRLSVVETFFGVGGVVGGALLAVWGGFSKAMHTAALGVVIMSLSFGALGITPTYVTFVIAMTILGFSLPLVTSPLVAEIQHRCDPKNLGRVMSLITMSSGAAYPLGSALFGPLADLINIPLILVSGACLQMLIAIALLKLPSLNSDPNSSAAEQS